MNGGGHGRACFSPPVSSIKIDEDGLIPAELVPALSVVKLVITVSIRLQQQDSLTSGDSMFL